MSAEAFKKVQEQWCERLISEKQFCDAVAILGPEGRERHFIRAHLAALSEPLCAALYGDFKEAATRKITLPDVSEEAFDVMLRSSHNLDLKLTPETAISTLQAAKVYLIDGLSSYCLHYLETLDETGLQLRAMTAALKSSCTLPIDMILAFCKNILLNGIPGETLRDFHEAHGSIIHALIQHDNVVIASDEAGLWNYLLHWSAFAVAHPELLGPFAEAPAALETCMKRARKESELEGGLGKSELAQRECMLQKISKHMRFGAMSKEFFFDNVRTWLTREDSDAVISCLCLGRPLPEVCRPKREGMFNVIRGGPGPIRAIEIEIGSEAVKVVRLAGCQNQTWKPSRFSSGLKLSLPTEIKVPDMLVVRLTFGSGGSMFWSWGVTCLHTSTVDISTVDKLEPASFQLGRTLYFELKLTNLSHLLSVGIFPRVQRDQLEDSFPKDAAELWSVTIFAPKRPNGPTLTDMADRLSSNIFGPINTQ